MGNIYSSERQKIAENSTDAASAIRDARIDELWKQDVDRLIRNSKEHPDTVCYEFKRGSSFPTLSQLPPVSELVGAYKFVYLAIEKDGQQIRGNTTDGIVVLLREAQSGRLEGAAYRDVLHPQDYEKSAPNFTFVQKEHQQHGEDGETVEEGRIEVLIPALVHQAPRPCFVMVISQPVELDWTPNYSYGGDTADGQLEFGEERLARLVKRHDYEKSWIYTHLGLPDACGKIVHDYWQKLPSPTLSLLEGDLLLVNESGDDDGTAYIVARRV